MNASHNHCVPQWVEARAAIVHDTGKPAIQGLGGVGKAIIQALIINAAKYRVTQKATKTKLRKVGIDKDSDKTMIASENKMRPNTLSADFLDKK